MARLFFALWPTEDVAAELARAAGVVADRASGRAVPQEKIHLTLAFLGEIAPERHDLALEAAMDVRIPPFTLVLDQLGAFRHAQVAWAGATLPDPALIALQATLDSALRIRGFALEARAFTPHVTLARRAARALRPEPYPAIAWRITDFALVCSEPGTGRYANLARWPLGGG